MDIIFKSHIAIINYKRIYFKFDSNFFTKETAPLPLGNEAVFFYAANGMLICDLLFLTINSCACILSKA